MKTYNIIMFATVLFTTVLLYQCAPDKNKPELGSIDISASLSEILGEPETNEKSSIGTSENENRAAIVQSPYLSGVFMLVPVSNDNNKSIAELKSEALEIVNIDVSKGQVQLTATVPYDKEIKGVYYLYTSSKVSLDNFVSVEPDLTGITNSITVVKGDNTNLRYVLKTVKTILKTIPIDLEIVAKPQYKRIDDQWVPFQNIAKDSTKDYVKNYANVGDAPIIYIKLPLKKEPISNVNVKATVTYFTELSGGGRQLVKEEFTELLYKHSWGTTIERPLTLGSTKNKIIGNSFKIKVEVVNNPDIKVIPKTYTMYYK